MITVIATIAGVTMTVIVLLVKGGMILGQTLESLRQVLASQTSQGERFGALKERLDNMETREKTRDEIRRERRLTGGFNDGDKG